MPKPKPDDVRTLVLLLLASLVVGAFCIQLKFQVIVWRANVDLWKQMPAWLRWVMLAVVAAAAIVGLMLGAHLSAMRR